MYAPDPNGGIHRIYRRRECRLSSLPIKDDSQLAQDPWVSILLRVLDNTHTRPSQPLSSPIKFFFPFRPCGEGEGTGRNTCIPSIESVCGCVHSHLGMWRARNHYIGKQSDAHQRDSLSLTEGEGNRSKKTPLFSPQFEHIYIYSICITRRILRCKPSRKSSTTGSLRHSQQRTREKNKGEEKEKGKVER